MNEEVYLVLWDNDGNYSRLINCIRDNEGTCGKQSVCITTDKAYVATEFKDKRDKNVKVFKFTGLQKITEAEVILK